MRIRIFEKSHLLTDGTTKVEYFAKYYKTFFGLWGMWIEFSECDGFDGSWTLYKSSVDELLNVIRATVTEPIIRELEPVDI